MKCCVWLGLVLPCMNAFDMVGWFILNSGCTEMTVDTFPFEYYSHVVVGKPVVSDTGVASCNTTDNLLARFVQRAHKYGKRVMWRDGLPSEQFGNIVFNKSWEIYRSSYFNSIGAAVSKCGIDGIEFDYEGPHTFAGLIGYMSDADATIYTQFMADVKKSMGSSKQIGMDMGVLGIDPISYPLILKPWVNVSMVISGAVDYINLMSYHDIDNIVPWNHQETDILPWQKDGTVATTLWGLPANKVNIGIGTYYYNRTATGIQNEVEWCTLSALCPNIDPKSTACNGFHVVSKNQIHKIGQYIKNKEFRGGFVWAANYDSLSYNNTLVTWFHDGISQDLKSIKD